MIYLLTGPIRSGKTTALVEWSRTNDVEGILTPEDSDARYFLDLTCKATYHMEAVGTEYHIEVGKFKFSKANFDRAKKSLLHTPTASYKVIDEIGKLEVRGEGFHDVLVEILDGHLYQEHLVLVIREDLLGAVKDKFGLMEYMEISKDELANLT